MHTKFNHLLSALTITAVAGSLWGSARADDHHENHDRDRDRDPVVLSFSTVGDSRQDPESPDPTQLPLSGQDAIWLQSTKAWSRIMDSIHTQKSDLLFFNGDMIMGYGNAGPTKGTNVSDVVNSDLLKFYRQYAFWRGMVATLMEQGTYVVPVPGNHEMQWKKAPLPGGGTGKLAQLVNEDAWRANLGDLILDTNRFETLFGELPAAVNVTNNAPLDAYTTDQSQLSYSFDFRGCHFVVINTDPVGHDAHAPVQWLAVDLATAKARGARHFFVFGHKPAYTYYFGADVPPAPGLPLPGKPAGLDNDEAARNAFWDLIEQYGATYFCGHEHIFNAMQPRASTGGKAWQILVGSGGSPFEAVPTDATINPATDRDYAWATVRIYASGKVQVKVYGFDDQFGPTRLLQAITLP